MLAVHHRDGFDRGMRRPWAGPSLYARAEWRVRWRSHLLLAGVLALTVTVVLAALTGARRSDTAFHRLRAVTRASDAVVVSPQVDRDPAAAVAAIGAIDGVTSAAPETELFARPTGTDLFPDYNLYVDASLGAHTHSEMNVPVVTKGRVVDPKHPDEMEVSEKLARQLGVTVGDRIVLETMTSKWADLANNGGDPGPPDGPKVSVKVVGLSRTPADFGRMKGLLRLSPAFVQRYGHRLRTYAGVHLRLTAAALRDAQRAKLRGLPRDADLSPSPFGDDSATNDGLGTIATALRLVGAIAALAGAGVTLILLARLIRLALHGRDTLVALGWTRRALVLAVAVVFVPALVVGIGIGIVGGLVLSPHALLGLARHIDPSQSSVISDARSIVGVLLGSVIVGLLLISATAWRIASVHERRTSRSSRRLPLRRPLPAALGLRHALVGEVSGGGRASRGALAITTVGLAGIVGALIVSASIAYVQTQPTLMGHWRGRTIDSGESMDVYDRALPLMERDRRADMVAGVNVLFGISGRGADGLTALAYDVKRGQVRAPVVHGRVALQSDEVAVGPSTLRRLRKHVGNNVELRGERGTAEFRIVGVTLFPEGDFAHDDGLALTAPGANRLVGDVRQTGLHSVAFEWADGVDARQADARLAAAGLSVLTDENALVPASVGNLGQVEAVPRFVAALLALLCVAAMGHALITGSRLRAQELATLRALGMTPRGAAGVMGSQALTVIALAVALGVPLGVAAGAQLWTRLADRAHVIIRITAPASSIVAYLATIAVAVAALAGVSAWLAIRRRPFELLRVP